jgi:hypothetical protein
MLSSRCTYFANLLADADPLLIDAETDPVKVEIRCR